jgi:hypothetical protein
VILLGLAALPFVFLAGGVLWASNSLAELFHQKDLSADQLEDVLGVPLPDDATNLQSSRDDTMYDSSARVSFKLPATELPSLLAEMGCPAHSPEPCERASYHTSRRVVIGGGDPTPVEVYYAYSDSCLYAGCQGVADVQDPNTNQNTNAKPTEAAPTSPR